MSASNPFWTTRLYSRIFASNIAIASIAYALINNSYVLASLVISLPIFLLSILDILRTAKRPEKLRQRLAFEARGGWLEPIYAELSPYAFMGSFFVIEFSIMKLDPEMAITNEALAFVLMLTKQDAQWGTILSSIVAIIATSVVARIGVKYVKLTISEWDSILYLRP